MLGALDPWGNVGNLSESHYDALGVVSVWDGIKFSEIEVTLEAYLENKFQNWLVGLCELDHNGICSGDEDLIFGFAVSAG